MDAMLQLFRAELLPKSMVEVREGFLRLLSSLCKCNKWSCTYFLSEFFTFAHVPFVESTDSYKLRSLACLKCIMFYFLLSLKVEDFVEPNGKISLQREETPSNRYIHFTGL